MAIEERVVQARIKRKYYICDICGFKTQDNLSCCCICGKHLCDKHEKYAAMFSYVYCETCYDLRDKYESDIDEANREFEEFSKKHEQLIEARRTLADVTIKILKEHWISESSKRC